MIQMIRESDGAPANAGSEIEAELLMVQGYRRVERPAAPAEQPASPEQPSSTEQPSGQETPAEGATAEDSSSSASRRRGTSS